MPPDNFVPITLCVDDAKKLETDLKDAAIALHEPWRRQRPRLEDIAVTVVSGGITNQLYRLQYRSESLLFRVYGAKTEMIIDRDMENKVCLLLTQRNFGAAVRGRVVNGRIEEFLAGSALRTPQLLEERLMVRIARRVAELHAFDLPLDRTPALFATLRRFLRVAMEADFGGDAERARRVAALDLRFFDEELRMLEKRLPRDAPSPVVFCHNDLLCGNVMYDPEEDRVTLIDYEYASYSYRAFDIANHFCEMSGWECDWDRFPSRKQQGVWLRAYLAAATRTGEADVPEVAVDALYAEVNPWVLASHLFWGFWSVVQTRYSPIEFDFLGYAERRLGGYRLMRASRLELLGRAK